MKAALTLLAFLQFQAGLLIPAAEAFLQDDLNPQERAGRIVVGGDFVQTPAGPGKPRDGGSGWLSDMRRGMLENFYGRRDFVLYHDLAPGEDLPIEQGTLEMWVQRHRPRGNEIDRDTLWQFLDAEGHSLLTVAIAYPGGSLEPSLIVGEIQNVWGETIHLPPVAVGEWFHLAFTWGPNGEADNHVFFNGRELPPATGARSGNLAETIRQAEALKLGTGYDDDDPAYHTLFDEFRFWGEIRKSFDLTRPLQEQP